MKILLLLFILFFISCGNEQGSKKTNVIHQSSSDNNLIIEEETIDGQYLAELVPLNPHLSDAITGAVTISLDKDEFVGDVRFFGNTLTAETVFEQTMHVGNRCPTLADDLNQDGILDEKEVLKVVGDILIPFDADLSSQWLGANIYPLSDSFGSYYYSQVTSFQKLLNDLREVDINLEDNLVKLDQGSEPQFEGKVALIRGISKKVFLPNTVEYAHKRGAHASLPLLCGVFQKVKNPPGRRNIDRYPLPSVEGENPDDLPIIRIPDDSTSPDYDIEPEGPITDYGS